MVSGNLKKEISGEAFYSAINNKLANYTYEADVEKRVIGKDNIEIIVTAANENLSLFMELTNLLQELLRNSPYLQMLKAE